MTILMPDLNPVIGSRYADELRAGALLTSIHKYELHIKRSERRTQTVGSALNTLLGS
jgi:hypothetical protein